jgi:ABC-type lipoprotein release transport system permease subunit
MIIIHDTGALLGMILGVGWWLKVMEQKNCPETSATNNQATPR